MMTFDYITQLFYLMWGLLVFTTIFFFISGLDDLFFDVYFWVYFTWRSFALRHRQKLTYDMLIKCPQKRIAVMIPCWHEAGVIEEMLKYNVYEIDYDHYDLFVGLYPNDPNTVEAVKLIAEKFPNIHPVVGAIPGPTNKASNLNAVYSYISEYEKKNNIIFDIFVMHDSEDIIHSHSFLLYNYLMPKNHMIQIPILPLDVSLDNFTHWTYNGEFSEIHTKDIIVREKIGGLVPSAGVGTAFTRHAMEVLKEVRNGVPFSTYSLTEDYSTALEIRLKNLRQIFVLQHVHLTRWRKRFYFFGRYVPYTIRECIATRGVFPLEYFKSVRQKTRWIIGIAFQEWIHTGWRGNLSVLYTLLHDRKSLITHLVTGLFFLQIPFWLAYSYYTSDLPEYPSLQDYFDYYHWVWNLIIVTTFFMINRFIQRLIAIYRIYGILPAILGLPLIFYGNIINLHALLRAYITFIFAPQDKAGGGTKWDKTDHTFPKHSILQFSKIKLGDLLVQSQIIDNEQLIAVLNEQSETGKQLGEILINRQYITQKKLIEVLAKQYHLDIVKKSTLKNLPYSSLPKISRLKYDLINARNFYPIKLDNEEVTLAIYDPSNEKGMIQVMGWIKPYKVKFVLIEVD